MKSEPVGGQSNYMPEIAGLRAFALTLVVFGHFVQRFARFQASSRPSPGSLDLVVAVFGNPAAGVLLFFTISGFLIATPFLRDGFFDQAGQNIKRYLRRRLVRIVLPYVLLGAATYVFISLAGFHIGRVKLFDVSPHSLAASFFGMLVFAHGWAFGTFPRLFPPGWSLEIEVQFYLIMPAIMFFYCKLRRARLRLLLGLGTFAAVVVVALSAISSPQRFMNYSVVAFMPYLWLGVLLADIRLCCGSKLVWGRPAAALVVGLLCAAIFVLSGPLYRWPWLNLMAKLSLIFVIFMCLFLAGRVLRDLCRSPLIAAIDGLSYPMYLTHLQTIQIVTGVLFGAARLSSWPTMFGLFLPVEVSLVVGVAYVFRTVVSPIQSVLLACLSAPIPTNPGPPPPVVPRTGGVEPVFARPANLSAVGADPT